MVAVITGSNRGIGKEIALFYAKGGFDLVLHYCHHEEEALCVKKMIEEEYHRKVLLVQADLSREEELDRMVVKLLKEFPVIDVLVNNAGIALDCDFLDKNKENFMKTLEVNLVGPFLLSKKLGQVMMDQKQGTILFLASTNALDTTYVESLDYDASKAGVVSLTHNLAAAFAPYVRVNAVCPGWVMTEMNQDLADDFIKEETKKILLGRFAEAKEIASLVYFLGTKEASYINDSIIRIDGGVKR